jgi:hypothetical protein
VEAIAGAAPSAEELTSSLVSRAIGAPSATQVHPGDRPIGHQEVGVDRAFDEPDRLGLMRGG